MPVELQNASSQSGLPDAAMVNRWVQLTLNRAADQQTQQAELCVRYVDAEEGARLNAQFRQRDNATNVLSFSADLATPGVEMISAASDDVLPTLLGDLVICGPVVAQEAAAQNKNLADHVAHMLVHGVLHLLGHDHKTDNEAQAMESLEISLLAELGVANPYQQLPAQVCS
jgi:probable rRNA maturation factor